jgi:hypothetical protein
MVLALAACGGGGSTGPDGGPGPDAAVVQCEGVDDCPAPAPCLAATCEAGVCGTAPRPAGTACGDGADACETLTCDGAGTCAATPILCNEPPASPVPTPCVGTFEVYLGGDCNTTCDPQLGCQYQPVEVACPTGDEVLPQDEGYQVVLRNYLEGLPASAFDVPAGDLSFDPAMADDLDDETLFRLWAAVHYDGYLSSLPDYQMLRRFDSTDFTLASIEASTPARTQVGTDAGADPVAALFYWSWDVPGNPYYRAPGALQRTVALTAADLVVNTGQASIGNLDNASGALLNYGYVGAVLEQDPLAAAEVDACTIAAYDLGLRALFDRYEPRNVGNGNGNMLISQASGYTFLGQALADPTSIARAEAKIAAQLEAICDPAGFCEHAGGGFDVYYEGWSENVLTSAALQSGWPSLRDAERRFYRLRSRTSFPQPAAAGEVPFCLQPTGFSPATPFGDCIGGGDYNHSRDLGIAALFPDDAAYLVAGGVPGEPPWPGAADDPRAAMIADITSSRGLQRAVSFQSGDAGASPLAWGERHYPRGLSAGVLFTPADAYATIDAALTDDPERARVPALRTPDYVEVFGDAEGDHAPQFFVGKFGGAAPWSAVIHTGVIDTYTGGGGAGFGGGALVSLWTAAQGQAIYSWNIGRNYDIDTWFDWSNLWQWPTHAASGRAGAIRFSSAGIGQPAVTSTVTATSAHVEVSGTIAEDATVSAPLAQAIAYARTFDLDEDGVRVTTTLAPVAAAPTVDELYETLPLFSYFVAQGDQTEAPGTASTVEFVVGGVAQPATETFTANVSEVRITRFGQTVAITFTTPRAMAVLDTLDPDANLAPLPDISQLRNRYPITRTLRIRLLDAPAALPEVSISYTIARAE